MENVVGMKIAVEDVVQDERWERSWWREVQLHRQE